MTSLDRYYVAACGSGSPALRALVAERLARRLSAPSGGLGAVPIVGDILGLGPIAQSIPGIAALFGQTKEQKAEARVAQEQIAADQQAQAQQSAVLMQAVKWAGISALGIAGIWGGVKVFSAWWGGRR